MEREKAQRPSQRNQRAEAVAAIMIRYRRNKADHPYRRRFRLPFPNFLRSKGKRCPQRESILIRRCGRTCRWPDMATRVQKRPLPRMDQAMAVEWELRAARALAREVAQGLDQAGMATSAANERGWVVAARAAVMEAIPKILIESIQFLK